MTHADWAPVERIYRSGIATGIATFDAEPPTWEQFDATRRDDLRFVAEIDGVVVGWAAASPVSSRAVYSGVVEDSVYVDPAAVGLGVGTVLLDALLAASEVVDVWTVQASIFPENTASVRLHESAGFRLIGRRERIALMTYGPWAGQWRDTAIYERRTG